MLIHTYTELSVPNLNSEGCNINIGYLVASGHLSLKKFYSSRSKLNIPKTNSNKSGQSLGSRSYTHKKFVLDPY